MKVPNWLFSSMAGADFTDGDIGQLLRLLYEYFVQDQMPTESELCLGKMKAAFYLAVGAMENEAENEKA